MEISEARLDNGLLVLLCPIRTSPVASLNIWYRVGSRNEVPGITGISHWVEHMQFKGTPTLKKGDVFRLVHRNGGANNAVTSTDFTAFYETLPSDRIDLALRIESDRMVNSLFDPAETASERHVIISEREGSENDPRFWLDEEVQATTFLVHPYHHETVGWKSDLQLITRDDLYHHYQTYYYPGNAVVVVAGDFDAGEMLDKLANSFGRIPGAGTSPAVRGVEPPQSSERRVTLRRPAPTAYFQVNFHGPKSSDPDYFPVFVLKSILGGVNALNREWRTRASRSSRLYASLIETQLVSDVSCASRLTIDPGTIEVAAVARAGACPEQIERIVLAELDRLKHEPVSEDELAQVLQQTRAQFVYGNESVTNLGYWLGAMEMVSSYHMHATFLTQVAQVTAADVQRVASRYLSETNRTVGWLIPSA